MTAREVRDKLNTLSGVDLDKMMVFISTEYADADDSCGVERGRIYDITQQG